MRSLDLMCIALDYWRSGIRESKHYLVEIELYWGLVLYVFPCKSSLHSSASELKSVRFFFVSRLVVVFYVWTECSVLGGKPATCAPHGPGAVPRVPGPAATAWMDPRWRASTEAESPGGTHLSGNERREAHHVQSWMRSYPRDPTDPAHSPSPSIARSSLFSSSSSFKCKSLCCRRRDSPNFPPSS